jgi:YegS/Rv2252/BmrU family lipid kinase
MRKAALLYNPESGGSHPQRQKELEPVLALLRNAGVQADLILTQSPAHAEEQTRQAVDGGVDTIFACGGDGTIHNLVQVVAGSAAALAILPMGTANALAHDLGVPTKLLAAAATALHATPRSVALGRVQFLDLHGKPGTRYFVVTAGVGVDAHLFYKLATGAKQRMGMAAYYAKAWRLWFTYSMPRFAIDFVEVGKSQSTRADVTELMAVRIRNFGGVLQELAPGASLQRNDLRLVYCRTASRVAYLAYVTRGLLRRSWTISGIDLAHADKVSCAYLPQNSTLPQPKIYVEADGELLGTLPVEITAVPNALTVLAPSR